MNSDLPKLAQPAVRALSEAGIRSMEQLTGYAEEEILQLHGIGPNALETLRQAMASQGLAFKLSRLTSGKNQHEH